MSKGTTKGGILLMGVLALVALSPAQRPPRTDPGAYVPGPNMPMPNYFTGTYNWVQGYVKPLPPPNPTDPPTQLEWIKLYVNGQQVKEIERDPDTIHLAMQISAVVDSTHFAHGSTLTVTVTALDEHGRYYTDADSAQITNVFRGFEHHDAGPFISPLDVVMSLGITGYGFQNRYHFQWPEADVSAAHAQSSAVLFATHGGSSILSADPPATNPPTIESINNSEVQSSRIFWHGTGAAPFNTGAPRTSLVVTLSCLLGNDPDWYINWFWPYWNSDFELLPNQAGHGYTKIIFFNHMHSHATFLFSRLREGKPIGRSRNLMVQEDRNRFMQNLPPKFPVLQQEFTSIGIINEYQMHLIEFGFAPIHGDLFAKLNGVYTGDDVPTLEWYR